MSVSQWMTSVCSIVSAKEADTMLRAANILVGNILPGSQTPWFPYRGICPSNSAFKGLWNWDSAFIAATVCRFDPILAQEQFKAMFLLQHPNGLVPDVVHVDPKQTMEQYGKPPVWAWAVEKIDRAFPDDEFLKYAYTRLIRNECFWRSERMREEDGLFVYGANETGELRDLYIRWESGWDNSVRWDVGIEKLYPIDLNCFMVGFYRSMQYIAGRLGFSDDVMTFAAREAALIGAINDTLWDSRDGCYYDYNFASGTFSRVLTPASFMPLYVAIADADRAEKMEKLAADPAKLYPGMPSVSYDDPAYTDEGYWRGPTWFNVAYFAAKGLYDYGFKDTAMGIRDEILSWVYADDSIHENYDSKHKTPLCARDFSWSAAFVIEFVLTMRH